MFFSSNASGQPGALPGPRSHVVGNVGTSTYPLLTHDMLLASNISHKLIVTNLKSTI